MGAFAGEELDVPTIRSRARPAWTSRRAHTPAPMNAIPASETVAPVVAGNLDAESAFIVRRVCSRRVRAAWATLPTTVRDRLRSIARVTAYELYLLLHIASAIVWMGAAFVLVLLVTRASSARDAERVIVLVEDGEWLGMRVFLPANLVVLGSALLLVHEGHWGYSQLWIRLGIAGFAISFLSGALFFSPGWARVLRTAAAQRASAPAVRTRVRRMLVGAWLDVGLLLGIVFVMTVKPTAGEQAALAVAASIPAAFALLAFALVQPLRVARP